MIIEPNETEQIFINAYLEAIDFTETGDTDQPEAGEELDADYLRQCVIDCLEFYSHISCYLEAGNIEHAGHDFWFSRNHHGVGYWDRPEVYGLYAKYLDDLAQGRGESEAVYACQVED